MDRTKGAAFKIIGPDNIIYGPVELPELVTWVREKRVTAQTWVYSERDDAWRKAGDLGDLKMFYQDKKPPTKAAATSLPSTGLKPSMLRRVKVLAEFNDDQLEQFVGFMEVQNVQQWAEIVKQGQIGDAMYLILEGELRVRILISGKESVLTTLNAGDFFGEISLFDHGPRSADVIANQSSILLKISVSAFQRLIEESPDLGAPFLLAVGKTLTSRIRADNKRFRESVAFARASAD